MNDLPNLQIAPSPLSNRIYAGYSRAVKGRPDLKSWTRKQDVTDAAVQAVLLHLLNDTDGMEWTFKSVDGSHKIVVAIKRMKVRNRKSAALQRAKEGA